MQILKGKEWTRDALGPSHLTIQKPQSRPWIGHAENSTILNITPPPKQHGLMESSSNWHLKTNSFGELRTNDSGEWKYEQGTWRVHRSQDHHGNASSRVHRRASIRSTRPPCNYWTPNWKRKKINWAQKHHTYSHQSTAEPGRKCQFCKAAENYHKCSPNHMQSALQRQGTSRRSKKRPRYSWT